VFILLPMGLSFMLDFYFSPGSCALASHILLEEVGADYRGQRINFGEGQQQSPDYLKINPKGRVPALITDKGILTETPAILVYIAQTQGAADLAMMNDPFEFARLQAFNSYLASTVHVAHAHGGRGSRWSDDEAAWASMKQKLPQSVGATFAYVEQEALAGPFVMGDAYTIADPYLFTVARWMQGDGLDPAQFPKVEAHMEIMRARPSTQAALAAEGLDG
jgi:glutathione S-transferase